MGLGNVVSNILLVITIILLISEIYRQQKILKSNCVIQQTIVSPPTDASSSSASSLCCPAQVLEDLKAEIQMHHEKYKTTEDKVDSLLHAEQALVLQQVLDKLTPLHSSSSSSAGGDDSVVASSATLFEMNRNLILSDVKEQVRLGMQQSMLYAATPS